MPEPTIAKTPSDDASAEPVSPRDRVVRLVAWVLESFGPLLGFWIVFRIAGLVPAIVVGIVVGAALVVRTVVRERRVSPFTAFTALSVVVFGALDLRYRTGFFVKLEPALGNAVAGAFFLASVVWGRPVIIELAERSTGRPLPHARAYLTGWTIAWGAFLFLRAAAYVWMAYFVTLERALELRAFAGPASFGAMFVLEFATRRLFARAKRTAALPEASTRM
jgi:intracellular septation protein A